MTREEAIAIIENEKECVNRANKNDYCNRDCYNCELVKTDTEILTALDMAIKALEQDPCEDVISRADTILQIQRHGVGCFDPDEFSPEVCERFVIDLISKLPSYRIESDDKESTEGHLTLLTECANSGYYCSECHKKVAEERSDIKQIKFCSKCGIKIVGAVEKL